MLPNGKPELLIPASSLEVLKVAVIYGSDTDAIKSHADVGKIETRGQPVGQDDAGYNCNDWNRSRYHS